MSEISISKVKLVDAGLGGVSVTYEKAVVRNNISYRDKHTVHFGAPANSDLLDAFAELRPFAVDICRLNDRGKDDVYVSEVQSDGDEFFKMRTTVLTYGEQAFETKTPKVKREAEVFDEYNDVIDVIKKVYKETRAYMKEKKVLDTRSIAEKIAVKEARKAGEAFDPKQFEGMDDEALTNFCREHLEEKKGAIVMMNEEPGKVISIQEKEEEVTIPARVAR